MISHEVTKVYKSLPFESNSWLWCSSLKNDMDVPCDRWSQDVTSFKFLSWFNPRRPRTVPLRPIWVRSESCLSMPPFTRCPVVKSCLLCTALSASLAAPGAVSSPHQRGWWWKLRPFQRLNWPSRPPTETDKPSPSKSLTKNLVRRRSWDPKWRWTHLIITIIINNLIGWSNISQHVNIVKNQMWRIKMLNNCDNCYVCPKRWNHDVLLLTTEMPRWRNFSRTTSTPSQ